jgi:mitochondrial ribonuclease P protein 3
MTCGMWGQCKCESLKLGNSKVYILLCSRADKIKSASDDHAATTCENLILALCLTEDWKESFKYLDMIRLSCRPATLVYSAIVKAAFDHGDSSAGWQLMEQVVNEEKYPRCLAYLAWIDFCLRERSSCLENLNKMLQFVEAANIILSERVASRLEVVFQEFDYKCGRSTISTTYQCTSCKRLLNPLVVSNEDFYRVRDSFLEKVLVRKDVFQKSSPVEVDRFLAFLDKNARPYDIIIDGLNVAYSAGTQKPAHVYSKLVSFDFRFSFHYLNSVFSSPPWLTISPERTKTCWSSVVST